MALEVSQKNRESIQPSPKIALMPDLDGTFLRHSDYSWEEMRPSLDIFRQRGFPIIFNSSKTLAEMKVLQQEMGLWGSAPVIAENGGGIFIPEGVFSFPIRSVLPNVNIEERDGLTLLRYGETYEKVREVLKNAANKTGVNIRTIGDMSATQFAQTTGLSLKGAELAKQRQFQEGFTIEEEDKKEAQRKLKEAIEAEGFSMTSGGRFFAIMGRNSSKGKAARDLIALYRKEYRNKGGLIVIGAGDAANDILMLEECDEAILVANPHGLAKVELTTDRIKKVEGVGPAGLNSYLLERLTL